MMTMHPDSRSVAAISMMTAFAVPERNAGFPYKSRSMAVGQQCRNYALRPPKDARRIITFLLAGHRGLREVFRGSV